MLCYNAAPGLWVIFRWPFEKVFTFETCVCACSRVCVCRCVCICEREGTHGLHLRDSYHAGLCFPPFGSIAALLQCTPDELACELSRILPCLSPSCCDSPVSVSVFLWFSGVCLRLAVAALGSTCWALQDFWGLTLTSSPVQRKHVYPLSHLLSPKDFIFFILSVCSVLAYVCAYMFIRLHVCECMGPKLILGILPELTDMTNLLARKSQIGYHIHWGY